MFSATALRSRTGPQQGNNCHLQWTKSRQYLFTVYLDGFSQAEVVHISELASVAEVPSATAAVRAAWTTWGIPRQLGNEVKKKDKIEVLEARAAGTLGRISLPRAVACKLVALSSWFCQEEPRTIVQAQIVGGRCVRAFQFRRELSSIFASFWTWIRLEKLPTRRRLIPESMVEDVLLAILSLPVCVADLRAKVSPLVVASDASEWELGLSRTSSLTAQGQVALQELQQATPKSSGSVGLVEGLRRAVEHCDVFVAIHIAVEQHAPAQRVLQAASPDVQLIDRGPLK